jgi:hypothetical protein
VTGLPPGALFTHTLHDGLLCGPLSPLSDVPVFRSPLPDEHDGVANYKNQVPYELQTIRAPAFRAFNYYRRAHPKVVRLLRKHKPHDDVDANDFFAASTSIIQWRIGL